MREVEVEVRLGADSESAAMTTVASPVRTPATEPHPGQALVASASSDLHLRQVSINRSTIYCSEAFKDCVPNSV